jgi:hypothetical protein
MLAFEIRLLAGAVLQEAHSGNTKLCAKISLIEFAPSAATLAVDYWFVISGRASATAISPAMVFSLRVFCFGSVFHLRGNAKLLPAAMQPRWASGSGAI